MTPSLLSRGPLEALTIDVFERVLLHFHDELCSFWVLGVTPFDALLNRFKYGTFLLSALLNPPLVDCLVTYEKLVPILWRIVVIKFYQLRGHIDERIRRSGCGFFNCCRCGTRLIVYCVTIHWKLSELFGGVLKQQMLHIFYLLYYILIPSRTRDYLRKQMGIKFKSKFIMRNLRVNWHEDYSREGNPVYFKSI